MYFEVYKDKRGEYRWRLKSGNHQVVATPGEGFTTKQSCMKNIDVVKGCANAEIKEIDD